MKSTQSTKTNSWIPITGANSKFLLIVIGAVLACSAPFVHMLVPKNSEQIVGLEKKYEQNEVSESYYELQLAVLKEDQKLFGYRSPRTFLYAIGTPITMLFFALLVLSITHLIGEQVIRLAIYFSTLCLLFIAVYHIVWIFWPRNDFPKNLYHLSIALMSLFAILIARLLMKYRLSLQSRIEKLIHFISIDAYFKYVKKRDKPEYIKDSYDVYDDIIK